MHKETCGEDEDVELPRGRSRKLAAVGFLGGAMIAGLGGLGGWSVGERARVTTAYATTQPSAGEASTSTKIEYAIAGSELALVATGLMAEVAPHLAKRRARS